MDDAWPNHDVLVGGRKIFHELSNSYKSYTAAENDAMFDRKEAEKEEKGLGWPSCQTFQTYGSKQCAGCQHKGKIESPLNLAYAVVVKLPSNQIFDQVKDTKIDRVVTSRKMHERGVDNATMFAVLNESCAVVKYGAQIMIASISGNDISFLKVDDFHKMFANIRVQQGRNSLEVSRLWFEWSDRSTVSASRRRVRAGRSARCR